MSLLVVLGTSAAYGYSVLAVVLAAALPSYAQGGVYFEASALIITFIIMGKWLEARAKVESPMAWAKELLERAGCHP